METIGRAARTTAFLAALALGLAASACGSGRNAKEASPAAAKGASAPAADNVATDNQGKVDGAAPASSAPGKGGLVVANINGEPVTGDDLDTFVREVIPGIDTTKSEEWADAIDMLISNRLLAKKALAEGLDRKLTVREKIASSTSSIWRDPYWLTVVRPTVKVTEADYEKAAPRFEDLLEVRQMVVQDRKQAEELRAQAVAKPADFERLVREKSEGLSRERGGVVANVTRTSPQYTKEVKDALFTLKKGQFSPVFESEIGHTFFQVLDYTTKEAARAEWRKTADGSVLKAKESEAWDARLRALAKKHRYKTHDKTLDEFFAAREAGKDLSRFKDKPALTFDNLVFRISDVADPTSMGVIHGGSAIEIMMKKMIQNMVVAAEVDKHGLRAKFPKVAARERFRVEHVLARAYVDKRGTGVKVSPEEVRKYYESHRAEFVREPSVDFSAIETKSPDRLEKIYAMFRDGKSFEEVAEKFNDNRGNDKGHVGSIAESKLAPEIAVLKKMAPGEVTKTAVAVDIEEKGKKGKLYLILRLNSRNGKEQLPFEKVPKGDIEKAMTANKREEVVKAVQAEIRKESKVEITKQYYEWVATAMRQKKDTGGKHGGHA